MQATDRRAREALRARLDARRGEIEQAAHARIVAIADPGEIADPAYAEGLCRTISAAIGYGIETFDAGEGTDPPIPVELLAQARLAARHRISLDTVLRRYFAGYSLFGFYLLEEAGREGLLSGADLQRVVASQSSQFDRLLAAVAEDHSRELESLAMSTDQRRRAERIERLAAGEPVDVSDIPYDFDAWHIGLLGSGPEAEQAVRQLASTVDCNLLLLRPGDAEVWAWLGGRRRLEPDRLLRTLRRGWESRRGPAGTPLATEPRFTVSLGEPADGLEGWRLTHRQALMASGVVACAPPYVGRYGEVALVATAARDDLLVKSLFGLYLKPLAERPDADDLISTLHAYFAADKNISSAAAALDVSRQTVRNRLDTVEELIGRPLAACAMEVELALRLKGLRRPGFQNDQHIAPTGAALPNPSGPAR